MTGLDQIYECKEKQMKNKFVLLTVLLTLALFSAACAAQEATNQPAEVTANPTVPTEERTATEAAGEVEMTPTSALEEATATQGAAETAPTASAEDSPATQDAGGAAGGIPQTGPGDAGVPDDLQEVIRVLQAAGATVEVGDEVQQDFVSATGRIIVIDGEEVRFFTYPSAEELELQASQLANQGDPESEPRFYKLGSMLVFYAGRDPGVRDLLEDVLGAHEAGQ
jgi:hypothetical protein